MNSEKTVQKSKSQIGRIREIRKLLVGASSKEVLNVLHVLRIEYAKDFRYLSRRVREDHEKRLKQTLVTNHAGVYLVVVVTPEGNVILYPGKTSGKSKTSGLKFRVRDHLRLLGKTPLTLFIPTWWIKRIHTLILEDKEKAKRLEKQLWTFLDKHVSNNSRFSSLDELAKRIDRIFKGYSEIPDHMRIVELQPSLKPKPRFLLQAPPAGRPRGLTGG